ncbi:metallophosphoesterase family protein [uncultured Megasphaera sp.]|uniref:metallophosphoesterase family protein n=2 Tax=Megasphaera TaxID=906 RepID=UPI002805F6C5|nr:metallophosphoesterase family protein [uncultured Megasphaera sp.]
MYSLKKSKKVMAAYAAAVICLAAGSVYAATEHWNDASLTPQMTTKTTVSDNTDWQQWKDNWDSIKNNHEVVSVAPGADASKLNFGWESKANDSAQVRIATSKNMNGAKTFKGNASTGSVIDGDQYYSNKVTVKGLKPETTYYYQVKVDGQWQDAQQVKTGNPHDFTFMYVGDPQIGASSGQTPSGSQMKQDGEMAARNDSFNWNKTLNSALAQHPEINFLVSPGDQINQPAEDQSATKLNEQEIQYAAYLSAAALRNLPEASSIGNHDSMTSGYQNHFNVPNPFTEESNPTKAGHGYYYTYGNALFIVINANNYNAADHEALIKKAIKAHPDTKWRIVVMHQDIYGTGLDHSDSDGILLRTQLTPIYDANKIDVVLQGHDHTYARTYQLSSDGKQHASFDDLKKGQQGQSHKLLNNALKNKEFKNNYESQNLCYTIADMKQGVLHNPKGVFYMSSNSATGSKYYNLIPQQQDYIAARSQSWRPTYSVVHITDNEFTINTYDVETGTAIDDSYSIVKD